MNDRISFKFNPLKTIEAILWLSSQEPGKVTIYKLLKCLFYADVFHLKEFGRPVTGDSFVAMKFGPVPTGAYDLLKGSLGGVYDRKGNFVIPCRKPNEELFSKSDIDALVFGWRKLRVMSFREIMNVSHDHPAYKAAWKNRGDTGSVEIPFEEIIKDKEKEAYLQEYGRKIRV